MLPDQIRKAEIAMTKVCLRALQVGAFISKPIFEGARYDYIIERDASFIARRSSIRMEDLARRSGLRKPPETDQER